MQDDMSQLKKGIQFVPCRYRIPEVRRMMKEIHTTRDVRDINVQEKNDYSHRQRFEIADQNIRALFPSNSLYVGNRAPVSGIQIPVLLRDTLCLLKLAHVFWFQGDYDKYSHESVPSFVWTYNRENSPFGLFRLYL